MKIGEVARAAGLTVETVRYYEAVRLLPRHVRTPGGYRVFTPEDLERIEFIQKAKRLGLSLSDIRDILAVQAADQATCSHVRDLLEGKIAEADAAIDELTEFRGRLSQLLERFSGLQDCRPTGGRVCSIIEGTPIPERPRVLAELQPARSHPAADSLLCSCGLECLPFGQPDRSATED